VSGLAGVLRSAAAGLALALVGGPGALMAQTPAPAAAAASVPDPERLKLGREIVDLSFPVATREAMFFQNVDAALEQIRRTQSASLANDPGAKAMVDQNVNEMIAEAKLVISRHIPLFMEAYARGYGREFSRDELLGIRTFVATPAGRHFVLRGAAILGGLDFKAQNESYLRELQPLMQARQRALQDKLLTYFRNHPPAPAKGS
jgi:hypothetical protein